VVLWGTRHPAEIPEYLPDPDIQLPSGRYRRV